MLTRMIHPKVDFIQQSQLLAAELYLGHHIPYDEIVFFDVKLRLKSIYKDFDEKACFLNVSTCISSIFSEFTIVSTVLVRKVIMR